MIEVRLQRSPGYAEQVWRDQMATRMRWRPFAIPLGVALLTAGVIWTALRVEPPIGFALCGIGVAELLWHWWDKRRWFAVVRGGKDGDVEVRLQFTREGIVHEGPNAAGEVRWEAFDEVARGKEGLFLVLPGKQTIYVPFTVFASPDDVHAVEAMFEATL